VSDTEYDPADVPEGMTALYDADVPRSDLVSAAANGIPRPLIAKQADGGPGLLDADYVRSLIAKAEPEPAPQETVTMTGSPSAIAAMIHAAAVRKAEAAQAEVVEKTEASTATMNDRDDSDFAYVEGGGTKDETGKTVPRSLRHYPIYDEAHARDALGRAGAQLQDGDDDAKRIARAALPKIHAAAKKFGIDVQKDMGAMEIDDTDGMDPTVVLAEPDMDAPGDPADPGSPAWEAIDAATARKWTAIAARLRAALMTLVDREVLESVSANGDDDDAYNAADLGDAASAIDYAISILAPFAVDEQSEADCGADMEILGKAMAHLDAASLETVEALAPIAKAGRTLSSANEAALRAALQSLQQVLASLPKAPAAPGDATEMTKEELPEMSDNDTAVQSALDASTPLGTPKEPASAEMPAAQGMPGEVAKAGKPPQVAIYDANGNLVGTVDPAEITMLAPAKAPAAAADGDAAAGTDGDAAAADDTQMAAADAATPTDLAPAPAATVGTPADAVQADDDSNVAKADTPTNDVPNEDMLKSSIDALVKAAVDERSAEQAELYKQLDDRNRALEEHNEALTKQVEQLTSYGERLAVLENAPAVMAIASNGAIPPAHMLRGQDRGVSTDTSQAALLKARFNASDDALEKKRIADEMQEKAIARFAEMQQAARRG
jgi:hypothetical protein